jgi:hypothetical protein
VLVAEKLFSILATENYLEQFFCLFEMYLARTLVCGPEIFGQILKRNIEMGTNVLDPNEISMRKAYITLIKKAQESGQILNCSPASELVDAAVYIADGIALVWSSRKGTLDFIPEHRRILNALFMADNK